MNVVILPWSTSWFVSFKWSAVNRWAVSYSVCLSYYKYSCTISWQWHITYRWYYKLLLFLAAPVSTHIRIRFSSSSGLPICSLTEEIELLMLIGIGFLGEEEILVIRVNIAWKRRRLSIFLLWDTIIVDAGAVWIEWILTFNWGGNSEGGIWSLFFFLIEGICANSSC